MTTHGRGAVLARIRDARGSAAIPVAILRRVEQLRRSGSRSPELLEEPDRVAFIPRRERRQRARDERRRRVSE